MTVKDIATPLHSGLADGLAFTKDTYGHEVMMGDLVLLQRGYIP